MPSDIALTIISLIAVIGIMAGELMLSRAHEAVLRGRGAIEPGGDVYRQLAWVYPLTFVAMSGEALLARRQPGRVAVIGLLVLLAAKILKLWAMRSLGSRWTFRVLVLPHTPLVTGGPYTWVRHPNYVAVFGEIAGFALLVGAPWCGLVSAVAFEALLRRRIAVEERALGRRP